MADLLVDEPVHAEDRWLRSKSRAFDSFETIIRTIGDE
jgi:hypothetical protein